MKKILNILFILIITCCIFLNGCDNKKIEISTPVTMPVLNIEDDLVETTGNDILDKFILICNKIENTSKNRGYSILDDLENAINYQNEILNATDDFKLNEIYLEKIQLSINKILFLSDEEIRYFKSDVTVEKYNKFVQNSILLEKKLNINIIERKSISKQYIPNDTVRTTQKSTDNTTIESSDVLSQQTTQNTITNNTTQSSNTTGNTTNKS